MIQKTFILYFKYLYKYKTVFYLSFISVLESVCILGGVNIDLSAYKCSDLM